MVDSILGSVGEMKNTSGISRLEASRTVES